MDAGQVDHRGLIRDNQRVRSQVRETSKTLSEIVAPLAVQIRVSQLLHDSLALA